MGVEPRPAGFISDLCMALAHRWEPERLFVIITIYLDESGTHDDSPAVSMGGLMANALQWARFETRLEAIRKAHGFEVFHTKEFTQRTGRFKGWKLDQCENLLVDLRALTKTGLMESVSATVLRSAYKDEYRSGEWPRRVRPDSIYGISFRTCLEHFLLESQRRCKKPPQIHVVLEQGAKNWGDCQRIFEETQVDWPVLKTFSAAKKEDCPPLWIGDVLATNTYRANRDHVLHGVPMAYGEPTPGNVTVLHLHYAPGALATLKQTMIEQHQAKGAKAFSRSPS